MQRILTFAFLLFVFPSCVENTADESEVSSVSDEELLDRVQKESFNYFWEGGDIYSGAAPERIHMDNIYPSNDSDVVTIGGTGFGIMATIAAINREFISREQGLERLQKLTDFLEKADRFHGAWPHWLIGKTGKTKPFSRDDDGGDLVETAFLAQGLITARQFFKNGSDTEKVLANRMDKLWKEIDWSWYTKGEDVLYWHWSPKYEWQKNFDVRGYNECLIMYILAAASPTHPVSADVYYKGFLMDGKMATDREFYGIPTEVNHYESNDMAVGPMFWAHYSFLGLDPHQLKDKYVDYWKATQNHALIQLEHCKRNPYGYKGYSAECWGLTSSYSMTGYAGHNPQEDLGVISPTAALSSFPYTPNASMAFLKHMYSDRKDLIGKYGPYDAFSDQSNWHLPRYLAIDQLPIPVMIENYRSGLLWDLFMSAPEIQEGLDKLEMSYRKVPTI